MSDKTLPIETFDIQMISDFFNLLERQGPGSPEMTIHALSYIDNLPDNAKIADLGCGNGGQTITLAENVKGHITALDLFTDFIQKLKDRIKENDLEDKISAIEGSMDDLPFAEGELDLIWCEGAIYNIGFEEGLKYWHKYLKQDGYVVVSEASWFTPTRPDEIQKFWDDNYPGIDIISTKVRQMEEAGYMAVTHFILPESCWLEDFYAPMPEASDKFLKKYNHSKAAVEFIKMSDAEIALYKKYKQYYGYVFYIGKKI